jgi:hypothetical protein
LLSLPVLAGEVNFAPALNLAICWKHFLNIVVESQSAGNLIDLNHLGILREYTPEFFFIKILLSKECISNVSFLSTIPILNSSKDLIKIHNENYNKDFASYLTGYIEGDGTIIVPKSERSTKGKLNYPSIQIAFYLRDFPFAQIIQKEIGHGSLIRMKGNNVYNLKISNFEGIILLINLLNGNMRTSKIKKLYELID